MNLTAKRIMCIICMILGVGIIIVGIAVMNPSTYTIGDPWMKFGGDFYTEIYDVTRDVGSAVQRGYKNICNAIGWLIIVLGIIDISYFLLKLVDVPAQTETQSKPQPAESFVSQPITQAHEDAPVTAPEQMPKNEYIPTQENRNEIKETFWICGKCKTKNLSARTDCWSCGNPK